MARRSGGWRSEATRGRQLDACIFCGGAEITQEHLVADWAARSFARSRRPLLLSASLRPGDNRVLAVPPTLVAGVSCRTCNTGWISTLDRQAAECLKPLVRGEPTTLSPSEQAIAAAWLFKTGLICDVADHGSAGRLAALRSGFMANRTAPMCTIFVGTRPMAAGAFPFGVRPADGVIRLTVSVRSGTGEVTPGTPRAIANPGYQLMIGAITAFMWGQRAPAPPVSAEDLVGFEQLWPSSGQAITIRPRTPPTSTALAPTDALVAATDPQMPGRPRAAVRAGLTWSNRVR